MEWVVGIQVDADARIFYVHMDDLKHCAPPDPEPSWPDVARGTYIMLSTYAPSTVAPTEALQSHTESGGAHQTGSVSSIEEDVRALIITDQSEDIHTNTNTPPTSVWDLEDVKCILSNVALTLRDFAFTQWKDYSTPCNFSLWVIRNIILDSSLNTRVWIMSKDA